MKKVLSLTAIVLAISVPSLAARTQTNEGHAAQASDKVNNVAPRSDSNNPAVNPEAKSEPKKTGKTEKKKKSDSSEKKKKEAAKKGSETSKTADSSKTASATPINATDTNNATSDAPPAKMPASVPVAAASATDSADPSKVNSTASAAAPSPPAPALTNTYRVGIGDVLNIQLLNAPPNNESTLFTVLAGGLLEYPLAGEPVPVAGLTTEEINAQLTSKIKIYEDPRLAVSVREYASHHVIITGLVNDPGTKVLRREAVPLYVVLVEAQPRAEAAIATIMRPGGQSLTIDLSDSKATSALVIPGDVIRLTAAPPPQPQYFFIGGYVNSPGQKDFHKGLTLMQAILASGGMSRFAGGDVKVMRQGPDGRLVTTRYNLKKIEEGKVPDPQLQAGDRVEVTRGGW